MHEEHKSLIVVIIGPLAIAGSIFTFLKNIGNNKPNNDEITKAITSDKLTEIDTNKHPLKSYTPLVTGECVKTKNPNTMPKDIIPKIRPFNTPIENSFISIFKTFDLDKLSS